MSGLSLTRKVGESLHIGPDIVVTVVEVTGGSSVRLRIEAPRAIQVWRDEHDRRAAGPEQALTFDAVLDAIREGGDA